MLITAGKWPFLDHSFMLYTRRYLQRSFHAIHLLGDAPQIADDGHTPLLVCLNHSSWWDVMMGYFVERELFNWEYYAVMDARQLQRYKFFAHLGVIGVDRTSLAGAKEFVRYGTDLLQGKRRSLWVTPQGRMVSNQTRPMTFQPGLSHLAAGLSSFYLARVAFHYEFWNERLPEAFVSVSPIEHFQRTDVKFDRKGFLQTQELALQTQVETLLAAVQVRDATAFHPLLQGRVGISPTYDALRAFGARLRGQSFSPEHGDLVTPQWKQKTPTIKKEE